MRWFRHLVCVVGGLGLFLASAQPKLNIAPQGGQVAISWPATHSTNVILQQTLAPWAYNLWTNLSQPPSSNNNAYYVLLSPTNDASFFRLFLAVNLADKPEHRKLQAELIEKLKAFQTATKDPWVRKWSYE